MDGRGNELLDEEHLRAFDEDFVLFDQWSFLSIDFSS